MSVKTIKSSATHGTINIDANRQTAVSDSDREVMVVAKLSNKGWQLAEMRGTEFAGSNPAYPMWWNSTQYLCGDIDSNSL